jgi:hypothetical protein
MGAVQQLIPLEEREAWEAALAGVPHAFAHTWPSCRAMYLTTGWPTFLYTLQQGPARMALPFAERGDRGQVDVVTPYGFGGVAGVHVTEAILEHWVKFALKRNYVCGYIGLNPLFAPAACRRSADYVEHNDIHVLELGQGVDSLYTALSTNRRRELRAFATGPASVVDECDQLAAFFLEHIDDFLRSRGASSTYAFSTATWRSLLDLDNVLVLGAQLPGSPPAAVSLFAYTPYCAEYLFGINLPGGATYSAPLIWAAATRLAERGIPLLNLGGGVRRGDGVAQFKERFGARRLPLGALKQVYRPDAYAALCRRAGKDPHDLTGFFPAHRTPV